LTRHDQGHAIDFQMMKDGAIIAAADYDTIDSLRAKGWDKKLKDSMGAAGPSFSGPLDSRPSLGTNTTRCQVRTRPARAIKRHHKGRHPKRPSF
jgi:hypothetical protein